MVRCQEQMEDSQSEQRGHDAVLETVASMSIACRPKLPWWSDSKASACNAGHPGLILGGKIPWRKEWQPAPVFLPGEFLGQRTLVGYSPWGHQESDMTEQLTPHFRALKKLEFSPTCLSYCCILFFFIFFSNCQIFLHQRWVYSRSAKNCNSGSATMGKPHTNSYMTREGEPKFCLLRTESCIDFLKGPKVLWGGRGAEPQAMETRDDPRR